MYITICRDHDFQCPICLQDFDTEEAININTNDQTNHQTRENKSFIGEIMEYLKVDSCFMSCN